MVVFRCKKQKDKTDRGTEKLSKKTSSNQESIQHSFSQIVCNIASVRGMATFTSQRKSNINLSFIVVFMSATIKIGPVRFMPIYLWKKTQYSSCQARCYYTDGRGQKGRRRAW